VREGLATVEIDGSAGEGGGQILRTSLALSMITGRPLRMRDVRAGRAKPGLRRQHLACVRAARELCGATVHGDEVGSQYLEFVPGRDAWASALDIDIGSAGSTSLVVQTILVPAIVANHALHATVHGGTHNPLAPPFDFLDRVFVPHLRAMGADVTLTLDRHGFATGGASQASHDEPTKYRGQVRIAIGPRGPAPLAPIEIVEAGEVTARQATAILARLPTHVAARELGVVRERLGFAAHECETREIAHGGPANVLMLEVQRGAARELVTAHGERGLRAEAVAARACDDLEAYLALDAPVGAHLADQLLLPLAAAGGGRFRCAPLSLHATTNIATIRAFLDIDVRVVPVGDAVDVIVERR